MKKLFTLFKKAFAEWQEDKASRLAAALAYYTIFSLAPLLVIVIAVAGLVFGQAAAQGAIVDQMSGLVGQQGAQQIQTMIQNASRPGTGILATVIGIVILLLGASGVFGQLQDAMNTIWEVKPKPGRGLMGMIKDRFLSFTMVLGIGFMLMVSLVVGAALAAFGQLLIGFFPGAQVIMQIINFLISFIVTTFLFVLFFKYLPDAKIAWRDVILGSAVTALLFDIGRLAIGLYLGNSNVGTAFGAAGSLIVLFVWVYYSSQILFFGAEFTQVYANEYGKGIVPADNAVRVTDEDRAQQGIPRRNQEQPARPAAQPEPTAAARTAVPASAALPVTGQPSTEAYIRRAQAQREQPELVLLNEALPALVALAVGLLGSLAIAREQRKRPLGRGK